MYLDVINGVFDWIVWVVEVFCCVVVGMFNFFRLLFSVIILMVIFVMIICFLVEFLGVCDGKNFIVEFYLDSIYLF